MLDVIKKRLRPEKGQVLVFSILLLPLVLGILALLVEMGNLYVHYWNLQHAADNAALAAVKKAKVSNDISESMSVAKEVADKNNTVKPENNLTGDDPFKIKTYTYPNNYYTDYLDNDNKKFFIKLTKDIPPFFTNVFGKDENNSPITVPLTACAAASKTTQKLTPIIKEEMEYIEKVAEDGEDKWREVTP